MKPVLSFLRGLGLALAGVLAVPASVLAQTTYIVTVGDNFFQPDELTIQVGDTVEWRNAGGGNSHNVRANNGSFQSVTASSFVFSVTFNSAGVNNYRCTVHPATMTGVVTVQGAAQPAELSMTSVNAPSGSFDQGENISINATVKNNGGMASGAFSVSYYASTDNNITVGDTLLGTENRGSLGAGAMSSGPFQVSIPGDLPPGVYFIGAIVNFNDSNSGNNRGVDQTAITVTAVFLINAGLNDVWFNALTAGQGFTLTVWPGIKKVFLSWFTFEIQRPPGNVVAMLGEPGHRWLTAFGGYNGDTANLVIEVTSGGVFDSGIPEVSQVNDGTITLKFTDCSNGTVEYDIPSLGLHGIIPIKRITPDIEALCQALD